MRATLLGALTMGALLAVTSASGEILHFRARLAPCSATPPDLHAAGVAELTLDTESKVLSWKVAYSGLSGPVTAGRFKGPAAPGSASGVIVDIAADQKTPLGNPAISSTRLNDIQIGHLRAGLWSVSLTTAKNPNGELRGDLERAP
jgi:CHRD domain